jgi:hypothetical protein
MRRGLQAVLGVLGCVAVVFGMVMVIGGAESTVATGSFSPSVDSELRFFAAWYVGAGVLLLRAARRPEAETVLLRGVCAVLVLAASARVLSMATVGRPHDTYIALTVVEYIIAVVVFAWQHAVTRRASTRT